MMDMGIQKVKGIKTLSLRLTISKSAAAHTKKIGADILSEKKTEAHRKLNDKIKEYEKKGYTQIGKIWIEKLKSPDKNLDAFIYTVFLINSYTGKVRW